MVAPSSGAGDRASAATVMTTHPYDWITGLEDDELRLTACPPYLPAPETTNLIVYSKKELDRDCVNIQRESIGFTPLTKGHFLKKNRSNFKQGELTHAKQNDFRLKCRNSFQVFRKICFFLFDCRATTTALVHVTVEADNVKGY